MKPLLITLNLLTAVDAGMTHHAIVNRGFVEIGMPFQNPYVLEGFGAGVTISESIMINTLNKRNHKKAARIIVWSLIAARSAVIIHNVNELRK